MVLKPLSSMSLKDDRKGDSSPQCYAEWEDGQGHHVLKNHNNNFIVGRIVNSPRQKSHIDLDDEDTIETASSSGSYSSGYVRPRGSGSRYSQSQPKVHYFPQLHQDSQTNTTSANRPRMQEIPEKFRDEKDGSEIYIMDSAYMKPPASIIYSHYSGKSRAPSELSSVKTKTSRKGGVVVETMSAPNPFCPNTKGVCCLLVLVNLGLILVTLGFSIVLQLYDPPFVWYCGIAFLIVGFTALIASLIFCVHLCRESDAQRENPGVNSGELYWTHHWQKRISLPSISREREKVDDGSTVYSTRTDADDKYYSRNQQRDMSPIHTYNHH